MKNKKFDCVQMTRSIRDKLYLQNKNLSTKEFLEKIVKESHQSKLWENLNISIKQK